jgi:hypothetical protein
MNIQYSDQITMQQFLCMGKHSENGLKFHSGEVIVYVDLLQHPQFIKNGALFAFECEDAANKFLIFLNS